MTHPNEPSIAALLRRYRDQAGLTQEELGERANLSYRSVSDIERGISRTPYPSTVRRLADALELSGLDRTRFLASARGTVSSPFPIKRDSNLPVETSVLIGREREEADALHRLRFEDVRLLTLTGPGGVGKTRLALRLLHMLQEDFARVHMIFLATLRDASLVGQAIASSLGVDVADSATLEDRLVHALVDLRTLLVVDNFEHVQAAAPLLGRLVGRCPDLRILVTSRAPLRLRDEHELMVPPLALPVLDPLPPADVLSRYPSVQLLCRRVRTVHREFELTAENGPAVAAICNRLEGLPLAIELAAAHLRTLSPAELLLRLDDRLQTLTQGPVDSPPRQRTMRDTIAWSYDLLSPEQQAFFARLGVFVGGTTAEGIDSVFPSAESLDLLASLVEASLVRIDMTDPADARYVMFETIREFALEMLDADPEAERVRERHSEYCARLAKTSEHELGGDEQGAWLARMEREQGNLRAAIEWADQSGRIDLGLAVAYPLWRFWSLRGYLTEGISHLTTLVNAAGDNVPVLTRAAGLYALGALEQSAGRCVEAREHWLACLQIDRVHADKAALGSTLNAVGSVATTLADYDEAERFLQEARRVSSEAGRESGVSAALNNLGNVARYRGRLREAIALYMDAMRVDESMGRPSNFLLENIALVYLDLGEYERAIELLQRSIAQHSEMGNIQVELGAVTTLALTYLERDDARRAYELGHEAVSRYRRVGDRSGLAKALHVEARALAALCGGGQAFGEPRGTTENLDAALGLARESVDAARQSGQRRMEGEMLIGLGYVHVQRGDLDAAQEYTERALHLAREVAWDLSIAQALDQQAHISRLRGNYACAVRWHGEAAGIRDALGAPIHPLSAQPYRMDLAVAREALGAADYEAIWVEGCSQAVTTSMYGCTGSPPS